MKQQIIITCADQSVYQGRISDVPIKHDAIIRKSIDLFDDDDPCIIHQSYVIKEYVDVLLTLFKQSNNQPIEVSKHLDLLAFLDLEQPEHCVITMKG